MSTRRSDCLDEAITTYRDLLRMSAPKLVHLYGVVASSSFDSAFQFVPSLAGLRGSHVT